MSLGTVDSYLLYKLTEENGLEVDNGRIKDAGTDFKRK